jgi:peptidoglycan/xylan/chitin deacetylase (PgdA/CDA1 family)
MNEPYQRPEPFTWPDGARICFTVTYAFEAFKYASQIKLEGAKPGTADHFSLSYGEYGAKAGIWRTFDLLEDHGIKATFDISGETCERYPHIIREMHQRGHEVAGHGWVNDYFADDGDPEGEFRVMRETTEAIEKLIGERPVGWASPANLRSDNTLAFQARLGLTWNADDASGDLPFIQQAEGKKIVILPKVNLPSNDLVVYAFPHNPPGMFFDFFKDTFDLLYEEGEKGSPKWAEVVLHTHVAGRPTLVPALRRLFDYVESHEGVHYARRRDIAQWVLERDV